MGLLAALLSAFFSTSKDVVSKYLAFRLDGTVSTFASFAFALPYYLLLLAVLYFLGYETVTCSLMFLMLVLARSVTDVFAEWMKMYAFAHGDLSMVTIIFSISPLFLLITSPLITRDPLSVPEVFAVVFVVAGSLVMVYRPSKEGAGQKKGILLAVGASVFFSLNSCFDRLAVQKGTPVFSGFTMTLLSAFFLCPFVLGRPDRMQSMGIHWIGFLVRGFFEIAFMVCKLYALQFLTPPQAVGFLRVSLLLSIISGRLFFKEKDFGRRLAAGVLILAGVVLIAWMQWQNHSPPSGP